MPENQRSLRLGTTLAARVQVPDDAPAAVKRNPRAATVQVLDLCYFGAILTSSFDVFLTFDLGSTFRVAQLLLALPILVGLTIKPVKIPRKLSRCSVYLGAWIAIQIVACILHGATTRGIGYSIWMIYDGALIVATPTLFSTPKKASQLLKIYILSFTALAIFGIVQLIAGISGIRWIFIRQWWIDGTLPRVNGFTYEPSYYATYLLLGWGTMVALLEDKVVAERQQIVKWPTFHFAVLTIAIIISSSRMGIAALVSWSAWMAIKRTYRRKTYYTFTAKALSTVAVGALAAMILVIPRISTLGDDVLIFLSGTGIGGTADHSVEGRTSALNDTLSVFLDNPIVGVGMGGIAEEVARKSGLDPTNRDDVKVSEGLSIAAEVLAGTGILGLIAATAFFLQLYKSCATGRQARLSNDLMAFLPCLGTGLAMELLILQLSQNIFRQYLWQHIAIIFAVASVQHRSRGSDIVTNRAKIC